MELDGWIKLEEGGEVVIVYLDESYIHAGHKGKYGWFIKRKAEEVNNAQVEDEGNLCRASAAGLVP